MGTIQERASEATANPEGRRQSPSLQITENASGGTPRSLQRRGETPAEMTETEAERVTAHLVELLGTVSHELRSPLAAIKGYAATLLRSGQRLPLEEQREFVQTIHEASERLEAVINRLMEMAQLEVAAPALMFQPLDVVSLVRASVEQAERAIAKSSRRLTLTLDPVGMPVGAALVLGDERRLRIVVDHVLENAMLYTADGGSIVVTLGVRRAEVAPVVPRTAPVSDDMLMFDLVVRDSGQGIPAADLQRIFERFHRVDMRLTREVAGLGLGLAICKRIVELHNGAIWAESTPGEGSAFHVLLPLAEATRVVSMDT